MIKPDQIPDEAAFALLDIYALWLGDTDQARAAIAAALNAWPGMHTGWQCIGCGDDAQIILPLPQQEKGGQ